jgi:hypothetical protein
MAKKAFKIGPAQPSLAAYNSSLVEYHSGYAHKLHDHDGRNNSASNLSFSIMPAYPMPVKMPKTGNPLLLGMTKAAQQPLPTPPESKSESGSVLNANGKRPLEEPFAPSNMKAKQRDPQAQLSPRKHRCFNRTCETDTTCSYCCGRGWRFSHYCMQCQAKRVWLFFLKYQNLPLGGMDISNTKKNPIIKDIRLHAPPQECLGKDEKSPFVNRCLNGSIYIKCQYCTKATGLWPCQKPYCDKGASYLTAGLGLSKEFLQTYHSAIIKHNQMKDETMAQGAKIRESVSIPEPPKTPENQIIRASVE